MSEDEHGLPAAGHEQQQEDDERKWDALLARAAKADRELREMKNERQS